MKKRKRPSRSEAGRQTVLVTGGCSGIGLAVVRRMVRLGARVSVVDRTVLGPVIPLVAGSGGRVFERDVRDFGAAQEVVRTLVDAYGGIDGLVCSAGISRDRVLCEMGESEWDEVLDVNLKGAFNYLRAVAPGMRSSKSGAIVTVSSINALRGRWGLANYSASKAGLIGLTRAAARELGKYGVRVNAVAPGLVRTPLTAKLPSEAYARACAEAALGRIAEPDDIASVIAFLLSDEARHVTGALIPVDGGQTV